MNNLERRALVAFPPVGEVTWSGMGPVGLLRYRDAGVSKLAVAVRIVSPLPAAGEPFLPGVPSPASSEPPPLHTFPPLRGRELVPFKRHCDVAFLGTLTAASPAGEELPEVGIEASAAAVLAAPAALELFIDEGQVLLSIAVTGGKVDLGQARAAVLGGGDVRLGPGSLEALEDYAHLDREADAERFQSAAAPLRFPYPKAGSRIAVQSDFFALDAVLGFEVFIRVDYLDDTVSLPVAVCDALTFDLDRRQVEWMFRAVVIDPAEGREIERIVVSALAPGQNEERSRVDAWLPHASFVHAAAPEHVRAGFHPEPLDTEELAMARYSTWDTAHCASTLPIEEVAQIQVELLRGRERSAVLEAHGLDTYHWSLEERAATDRLAEAGMASIDDEAEESPRGPVPAEAREDVARYRQAYAQALAETPFEGRPWNVPDYAELRAALEVRNPIGVLERAELSPAQLIGLDMAMASRFEASPAERMEFDELFAQALARLEAAADNQDDFSPPDDEDDEDVDEEQNAASNEPEDEQ